MKLRNKNTGEITDFKIIADYDDCTSGWRLEKHDGSVLFYDHIDEIHEEWEDYKPSEVWYITSNGEIESASIDSSWVMEKAIGNYFERKKDAEEAVEKLEALKSLKDKGFEFEGWHCPEPFGGKIDFTWNITIPLAEIEEDLDTIFGE